MRETARNSFYFFLPCCCFILIREDKCDLCLLLFAQEDIFQSVGVPLVKNALDGYNTSILSYGQVLLHVCYI